MGGYVATLILVSLPSPPRAWAEPEPGEMLGQENWQEAKGFLPDAVLHRFQDGSYEAKITTFPIRLTGGVNSNPLQRPTPANSRLMRLTR